MQILKYQNKSGNIKYSHCEIALRLDDDVDFDIDNDLVKRFIDKYIVSCGAISGRPTNPTSHYWWKGKLDFKQFALPKELETHYKHFPHGGTLCEIKMVQHVTRSCLNQNIVKLMSM